MENFFLWWVLVAFGFLFFELLSPGLFFFISFSIGAVITALASFVLPSCEQQIVLFLITTSGALYVLLRWVKQLKNTQKSNVAALLGRKVLVVEDIQRYKPGAVLFDGSIWTAHTHHESFIKGDIVMIHEVRGAHVVVIPIQ